MPTFRLLSDLHFEFYTTPEKLLKHIPWSPDDLNTHLILAGDIGCPFRHVNSNKLKRGFGKIKINGNYVSFLRQLRAKFASVTMIAGNHEYYQARAFKLTMGAVDQYIADICDDLDIVFLQCNSRIIDGVTIYGCTLFSNVSVNAANCMNDTTNIADHGVIIAKHCEHLAWLRGLSAENGPNIVVTHHLPTYIPQVIRNAVTDSGYYTEIIADLAIKPNVWCCGHVHTPVHTKVKDTEIYISPHGYPNENRIQNICNFTVV